MRAISRNFWWLWAARSSSTVSLRSTGFASPAGRFTTEAPPLPTTTSLSPARLICWMPPEAPIFFASPPDQATLLRPAASPMPPMK